MIVEPEEAASELGEFLIGIAVAFKVGVGEVWPVSVLVLVAGDGAWLALDRDEARLEAVNSLDGGAVPLIFAADHLVAGVTVSGWIAGELWGS